MHLKNCTRCGNLYSSSHQTLCPECLEKDEEDFKKVRNFVKDNPKVAIEVVVEATGVPEEQIREYVRNGRLDVAYFAGPVLHCARCGKPISSGDYCVLCQKELSETFTSGTSKPSPTEEAEKNKSRSKFARYARIRRGEEI